MEAVKKVPVWSKKQLDSYLFFIKGPIGVVSSDVLKNLNEIETNKKIEESEERFQAIADHIPGAV